MRVSRHETAPLRLVAKINRSHVKPQLEKTSTEVHGTGTPCVGGWLPQEMGYFMQPRQYSDTICANKERAWKEIENGVKRVSTYARKWQDLRRKLQVERSNVKKKVQQIRRILGITGNIVSVPCLSELETKISSLLTPEEVNGIDKYEAMGVPKPPPAPTQGPPGTGCSSVNRVI